MKRSINFNRQLRRKLRISRSIIGSKDKPRISVFRSNKYIYAQAINDKERKTIMFYSSKNLGKKEKKTIEAYQVGQKLANLLIKAGIEVGVFDRGRYAYKGRVKALAEGLRKENFKI